MTQEERLDKLIAYFMNEEGYLQHGLEGEGESEDEKKNRLRALMNVRPPRLADKAVLAIQDEYLREENRKRAFCRRRICALLRTSSAEKRTGPGKFTFGRVILHALP